MLIVSLPPVHQTELLKSIIEHPLVGAVRYNTGMSSAFSPAETIRRIQMITEPHGKPLYVDLKGKQLRVIEWANLPEGAIILNHKISVDLPAKVYFRGDDCCEIREIVNGNEIYVDPLPKAPVGRGQSVNIVAESLLIEGGLIDLDYAYIEAALQNGIGRFMLSFAERWEDVRELEEAIAPSEDREIVFKIESKAGVEFVKSIPKKTFSGSCYRLMAARDDLTIQIGVLNMPAALKEIAKKDKNAICASRLLMGLDAGEVSMADISDLEYMRSIGYNDFMLSDGISRNHFEKAVAFWKKYVA